MNETFILWAEQFKIRRVSTGEKWTKIKKKYHRREYKDLEVFFLIQLKESTTLVCGVKCPPCAQYLTGATPSPHRRGPAN